MGSHARTKLRPSILNQPKKDTYAGAFCLCLLFVAKDLCSPCVSSPPPLGFGRHRDRRGRSWDRNFRPLHDQVHHLAGAAGAGEKTGEQTGQPCCLTLPRGSDRLRLSMEDPGPPLDTPKVVRGPKTWLFEGLKSIGSLWVEKGTRFGVDHLWKKPAKPKKWHKG